MGGTPENNKDSKPEEQHDPALGQQEPLTTDTLSQHAMDEAELDSVAGGKASKPGIGGSM